VSLVGRETLLCLCVGYRQGQDSHAYAWCVGGWEGGGAVSVCVWVCWSACVFSVCLSVCLCVRLSGWAGVEVCVCVCVFVGVQAKTDGYTA
jgi:hypothetical protein